MLYMAGNYEIGELCDPDGPTRCKDERAECTQVDGADEYRCTCPNDEINGRCSTTVYRYLQMFIFYFTTILHFHLYISIYIHLHSKRKLSFYISA